MPLWVEEEEG